MSNGGAAFDSEGLLDLDRCAGVLLGLAVGDALGAGYEFRTPPREMLPARPIRTAA
ncbi:MAG: hypothetical protein ACLPQS_07020 [Acidimicrobiales bacterium]